MSVELTSATLKSDIALATMDNETRARITKIRDGIDITDEQSVMKIGSEVSREISSLNKTVLSTVKVKDIPEIESIIPQLTDAFKEVDSRTLLAKKQSFLSRVFQGDKVKDFIAKFENAEGVVAGIQKNLQQVELELRKDIEIENQLGIRNMEYIQQLQEIIIGTSLKLQEALDELDRREAETDPTDIVAMQRLEEFKDHIDGLDKQIFWLEQQRMLAIQTLPILRDLKNNNKDMVRQITLTLQQSIPAWEQGIIIAFHIHRQQGALRIERSVHDMTNNLVKQNSQLLKDSSIEIAKAVQAGMIDIETFREANNNIIETSRKLTEIKNTAVDNRKKQIEEYRKLATQLIEAEKREVLKLAQPTVGGAIEGK